MPSAWILVAVGVAAFLVHRAARSLETRARDDLDREAARVVAELLARGGGHPAVAYEAVAEGRGDPAVVAEVRRRLGPAHVRFERRRDGGTTYVFTVRATVDGRTVERERPIDFDAIPGPVREELLRGRDDRVERPYAFAPEAAS